MEQDLGGCSIRRDRNIVHVAHFHEGLDVGLVRMRGERIAQEDDGIDLFGDDARPDLEIAALRTTRDEIDVDAEFAFQQTTRRSRSNETERAEHVRMGAHQVEQLFLLLVVRNKGQGQRSAPESIVRICGTGRHARSVPAVRARIGESSRRVHVSSTGSGRRIVTVRYVRTDVKIETGRVR